MIKIVSHSERETKDLGKKLIGLLGPSDVVCLFGTLGAGKTVLVKGMARGLGLNQDEVISPTFVLIREYFPAKSARIKLPLYHFDLYRLKRTQDILSLGCDEYFYGQGVCVIEWAERLEGLMPEEFLKIELRVKGKHERGINLVARGKRYQDILKKFNKL